MPAAPIDRGDLEAVLAPFGRSRTLPASAYTDASMFAWERTHVFAESWVCLGRLNELLAPGQVRALETVGEGILLSRDPDGELRGFSNVCRHRGHELAPVGDAIDVRLIRCPYHSWTYRLDGTLKMAPSLTQTEDFNPEEFPLFEIPVDTFAGWVFVNPSGTAGNLADHLGNLTDLLAPYELGRLATAATHFYTVQANWKVLIDNYSECYHCANIHPDLCEVTPPESGRDRQPTGMWFGGTMDLKDHAATMSFDGSTGGVNFRGINADLQRKVWYLAVMPNLLISANPDYVMTHLLTPVDVDRTEVECSWLFAPESTTTHEFDPSYAVDFWDLTNRQDWAACEAVQRGVSRRGYHHGPLSSWEGTIYQFHGMMARVYLGHGLVVPVVPATVSRQPQPDSKQSTT